ncbi:hypothetical protein AA637_14115 [Cyanobacterium sp. HL-69]|nr:hypothetical protein AA637_14115 [Cyanobacterium sp. HL-69]
MTLLNYLHKTKKYDVIFYLSANKGEKSFTMGLFSLIYQLLTLVSLTRSFTIC